MTSFRVKVPQHQARLVVLAVGYHLSRPGAEIDPDTLSDYRHGLREVMPLIEAQVEEPAAEFALNALQATMLSTAFSSVLSELKMYATFDSMAGDSRRPRSTAAGFDDRLRDLFPAIAGDPMYASQLAQDMAILRRELPFARAREVLEAPAAEKALAQK